MPTCTICANAEAATVINELLLEGKSSLDEIAEKVGCHRSSIYRHNKNCFPAWRAARVKSRNRKNADAPRRIFVRWPSDAPSDVRSTITRNFGTLAVPASQITPNDVIFEVSYNTALPKSTQAVPAPPSNDAEPSA